MSVACLLTHIHSFPYLVYTFIISYWVSWFAFLFLLFSFYISIILLFSFFTYFISHLSHLLGARSYYLIGVLAFHYYYYYYFYFVYFTFYLSSLVEDGEFLGFLSLIVHMMSRCAVVVNSCSYLYLNPNRIFILLFILCLLLSLVFTTF